MAQQNPGPYWHRILTQGFALLSLLFIIVLSLITSLKVDYFSFAVFLVVPAFLYIGAAALIWRGDEYLAPILELIAAGILLSLPILISTYVAMSFSLPMVDRHLVNLDQVFGFEWLAFIQFVDAKPWLARLFGEAYGSFEKQLLLVVILLGAFRKIEKASAFITAFGLLCFISSFIAIWYPALGAYAVLDIGQTKMQNINVHFGYHFLESFHGVRSDPNFELSLGAASGIITFPSVHAGVAFLIMWAMWDMRFLRYPFLIWNMMMAISAITHGSHYMVDVLAGAGVAGISVAFVTYVFLRESKPEVIAAANHPGFISNAT